MKTLPNIHPGEVLLEEFLSPMGFWMELQANYDLEEARKSSNIVYIYRILYSNPYLQRSLRIVFKFIGIGS
ncbi:Antitoxin HigA [hydrothermal vent metagenome]|uniref:Antitoxin HigA n=1 Tax=hydrothermal vent metagenome TaxID=652676 RepID=A0A3B0Z0J9_9ZZZZ